MPIMSDRESMDFYLATCGVDNGGVFRGPEGPYKLQQVFTEFAPYLLALQEHHQTHPIRTYLEIGCAAGGVARVMWDLFKPDRIVLCDNNSHRSASQDRIEILSGIPHVEVIGDSEDGPIQHLVFDLCCDKDRNDDVGMVDLLFIDANHEDPYPTLDAKNYAWLVKVGGLVAFHDLNIEGPAKAQEYMRSRGDFEHVADFFEVYGIGLWRRTS